MGDLREVLEGMKDTGDDFWTKRLMVEVLAKNLAWDSGTEKELEAALSSIIGNFFTTPGVDLNNAAARAMWLEAHFAAWSERLNRRAPTQENL